MGEEQSSTGRKPASRTSACARSSLGNAEASRSISRAPQAFSYAPSESTFGYSALEEEILAFHSAFTALMNSTTARLLHRAAADDEPIDVRSLRQYNGLLAELDGLAADERYKKLWFDFRHITDELVFYGMRAQTSHLVSPLANLCYKMLYRHDIFDSFLERSERQQHRRLFFFGGEARPLPPHLLLWVKQLSYFLMHFPDVYGGIEPLRRLEKALKRQGARHSAREVVDGLRGERAIGVGNGESDRDGGGALPDDAGPSERLGERSLLGASLFGGGGGGAAGRSGGAAGSRTRTL